MGYRATVAMAKASRIPEALNIAPTDPRFLSFLNTGTERLLHRGKYWNTYAKYTVSVSSQLLTLPPYIDTPEQIAVSRKPLPLRTTWFQFSENGWGTRDATAPNGSGIPEVLHLGQFPTIADIATAGTLTVKCDRATDVGKSVLILGYDVNANWVRTLQGGIYTDGEVVLLAQGAGTSTVTQFSQVTDIQAPTNLDGQWWLYLGGTSGTLLGNYQYWDTTPNWKRYLIPFIDPVVTTVELMGKKAFVPVKNDADFLVIGNLAALKLACMACKSEEEYRWDEANLLWNGGADGAGIQHIGAVQELEFELRHHTGDGQQIGMTVVTPGLENNLSIGL